ncbi:hypothetical protein CY652_14005 [Burkholderia sp. WAC0059]|uniref:thioesterase II family protein n=1 Tax=Burkholderia sp. WAC0059 TaxID=2066022 RepID=UPI000C7EAE74|nr:alpha/beta fold hydrolase [Burkholderia sp. WAC0059]PLZ01784.1 hypothetical protein CY652_14005 [Burkholderia sp. WAC0059]
MPDCRRSFVILPYAGGTANSFRALGKRLSTEGDVFRIDYPPLTEHGVAADRAIAHLSDHVYSLLQPITSGVVLFGHSMGGLVAYELARRLQQDARIEHLFISGCAFPASPTFQELTRSRNCSDLARMLIARGGIPDGTPAYAHDTRLAQHLRAILAYRFDQASPSCPLTCLAGSDDVIASHESMLLGQNVASRTFRIFNFPGGHFFFSGQNRLISDAISQSLS